jgi:hypothetical protein
MLQVVSVSQPKAEASDTDRYETEAKPEQKQRSTDNIFNFKAI